MNTTEQNMVERVAKAIYLDGYRILGGNWDAVNLKDRIPVWYPRARAAIEALREPTEEMMMAGNGPANRSEWPTSPKDVWKAMIDEALKEQNDG